MPSIRIESRVSVSRRVAVFLALLGWLVTIPAVLAQPDPLPVPGEPPLDGQSVVEPLPGPAVPPPLDEEQLEWASLDWTFLDQPLFLRPERIREDFIRDRGKARVVVHLLSTTLIDEFELWHVPVVRDEAAADLDAIQDALLDSLPPGEFELKYRYDTFPALHGRVSLEGLRHLMDDPSVRLIEGVEEMHAHTLQGVPLMRALAMRSTFDGAGVSIAIVDTGVDYNHPSLRLPGGPAGFPNGKVIGGWDFGDNDSDPMDQQGHGTSSASVAAGTFYIDPFNLNYFGGVAPNARIYGLKIVQGGNGTSCGGCIASAWDWAVTHKLDDPQNPILVMNTSFGGGEFATACDTNPAGTLQLAAEAAWNAGIVNFASSGNHGLCSAIASPACYSRVISVGALYDGDFGDLTYACLSTNSCIGEAYFKEFPTVVAKRCTQSTGASLVCCYSNSASILDLLAPSTRATVAALGGGFRDFGGTSAASPYAAGAGVLLAHYVKESNRLGGVHLPTQVKDWLTGGGVPVIDFKNFLVKPRVDIEGVFDTFSPIGDHPCDAIFVQDGATLFTNRGAFTDTFSAGACSSIGSSIWFSYRAPCRGTVTVDTFGSDFDTMLVAYSGTACSTATYITCNDDAGGGLLTSFLTFSAEADAFYTIRVGGFNADEGYGKLTVSCAPENDPPVTPAAPGVPSGVTVNTLFSATAVTTDPDGDDLTYTMDWGDGTTSMSSEVGSGVQVSLNHSYSSVGTYDVRVKARDSFGAETPFSPPATIVVSPPAPSNDACANAFVIGPGETGGTLLGASVDGATNCVGFQRRDVWYRYTAPCAGVLRVDTCGSQAQYAIDTVLSVHSGCPGNGTNQLVCNDDSGDPSCGGILDSSVSLLVAAGETVRIRVASFDGAELPFRLNLRFDDCTRGNVNTGVGSVAEVLTINGSPGSGCDREVVVPVSQPITVGLAASPAGPSRDVSYVLWVWTGGSSSWNPLDISYLGTPVGCLINPNPANPGPGRQPRFCLRSSDLSADNCLGVRQLNAPPRAPFSVTRGTGFGRPIKFTLQALVEDNGSPSGSGFSVSNAVILCVE